MRPILYSERVELLLINLCMLVFYKQMLLYQVCGGLKYVKREFSVFFCFPGELDFTMLPKNII